MADSDLITGLESAFKSVGKTWKKEKLHQDRVSSHTLNYLRLPSDRQTVKDAANQVMQDAILMASGMGRYRANARQIMYAARPLVLEITGGKLWKDSAYFTQNILKDYIEEHEEEPFIDKIVWDSRGHFIEPHTNKIIPIGGAAIADYRERWINGFDIFELPEKQIRVNTNGPKYRFNNVLFIEKEGFDEIIAESGILEKYDIARMSTKGIPVEAACQLAGQLSSEGVHIFVLHDFDFAGFKIVRTLEKGTRLSSGTAVVDLGLRINDVKGLQAEQVQYQQIIDPRIYLKQCGATEVECNFLVDEDSRSMRYWSGKRVELNAMISEQLITWLDIKLNEHGVKKVIPNNEILAKNYQSAAFRVFLRKEIEKVKEEFAKEEISIPQALLERVTQKIEEEPTLSWDEAIYQIAEEIEEGS